MSDENSVQHSLLVSFPDPSPSFTYGFEAGRIWEMMSNATSPIDLTTRVENQEIIRRMCDHCGYEASLTASEVEGWDYAVLTKVRGERDRPNPHGLRVV